MVTYSAPVLNAAGMLLAVVTIDIRYNQQVKGWFREAEEHGDEIQACASCGLPCPESYWRRPSDGTHVGGSEGAEDSVYCDCCVEGGLVHGPSASSSSALSKHGEPLLGGTDVRTTRAGLQHVSSARW